MAPFALTDAVVRLVDVVRDEADSQLPSRQTSCQDSGHATTVVALQIEGGCYIGVDQDRVLFRHEPGLDPDRGPRRSLR